MNALAKPFKKAQAFSEALARYGGKIAAFLLSVFVGLCVFLFIADLLNFQNYPQGSLIGGFLALMTYSGMGAIIALMATGWISVLIGRLVYRLLMKFKNIGRPSNWLGGWLMPLLMLVCLGLAAYELYLVAGYTPSDNTLAVAGVYVILAWVCLFFSRGALLSHVVVVAFAFSVGLGQMGQPSLAVQMSQPQQPVADNMVNPAAVPAFRPTVFRPDEAQYQVVQARLRLPGGLRGPKRLSGQLRYRTQLVWWHSQTATRNAGFALMKTAPMRVVRSGVDKALRGIRARQLTKQTTGKNAEVKARRTFTHNPTIVERSTPKLSKADHFRKHGKRLPGKPASTEAYAQQAQRFMNKPPKGTLTGRRPDGDIVRYNPKTGVYGTITSNGRIKTYMKLAKRSAKNPDGYSPKFANNKEYFYASFKKRSTT